MCDNKGRSILDVAKSKEMRSLVKVFLPKGYSKQNGKTQTQHEENKHQSNSSNPFHWFGSRENRTSWKSGTTPKLDVSLKNINSSVNSSGRPVSVRSSIVLGLRTSDEAMQKVKEEMKQQTTAKPQISFNTLASTSTKRRGRTVLFHDGKEEDQQED